jgi:hypothetical protein
VKIALLHHPDTGRLMQPATLRIQTFRSVSIAKHSCALALAAHTSSNAAAAAHCFANILTDSKLYAKLKRYISK